MNRARVSRRTALLRRYSLVGGDDLALADDVGLDGLEDRIGREIGLEPDILAEGVQDEAIRVRLLADEWLRSAVPRDVERRPGLDGSDELAGGGDDRHMRESFRQPSSRRRNAVDHPLQKGNL